MKRSEIIQLNQDMLSYYSSEDLAKMKNLSSNYTINDLYTIISTCCKYDTVYTQRFGKNELERVKNVLYTDSRRQDTEFSFQCTNLMHTNKYGLFEYKIEPTSKKLNAILWKFKVEDCLSYVENRGMYSVVSIKVTQLSKFIALIKSLGGSCNEDDMHKYISFVNKSNNQLLDLKSYHLPFTPYPYQIEDAKKIIAMKRCLCGHDMGLGKTFISILVGESIKMPKLVICPESLRLNWKHELLNVNPNLDVQVLLSSEEYHTGKDWTIIGYITASKFLKQLKEFKCLFVDEAHYCKAVNDRGEPTSKRAKAVIELADKAEYCYLLTGTPVPSSNRDLFNILKMLHCEEFNFHSQWAFRSYGSRFCDPITTPFGRQYAGNSNSKDLHELLKPLMVRRLKKDVLPDLKKQRQFIPIEPKFKKDYLNINNRLYEPGANYLGLAMSGREVLSRYKVPSAIELAETMLGAEESVVIVTNFIRSADMLKEHFKDNACEIRGGMSDAAKEKAKDDFQSKKTRVCILNTQAGGVGITLTAAKNMIVLDYSFVPAQNIQVEDRICRVGQHETCNIYYIYCQNAIFDKIFVDMLTNKSINIDTVVDNEKGDFNLEKDLNESSTYLEQLKKFISENKKPKKSHTRKKK